MTEIKRVVRCLARRAARLLLLVVGAGCVHSRELGRPEDVDAVRLEVIAALADEWPQRTLCVGFQAPGEGLSPPYEAPPDFVERVGGRLGSRWTVERVSRCEYKDSRISVGSFPAIIATVRNVDATGGDVAHANGQVRCGEICGSDDWFELKREGSRWKVTSKRQVGQF